jgi:hypothetical protein
LTEADLSNGRGEDDTGNRVTVVVRVALEMIESEGEPRAPLSK